MMHPDFRTLLAAYTPDELATIFREELEALRIPYTIKHPTHFQFTPLSSDDFDSGIVSLKLYAKISFSFCKLSATAPFRPRVVSNST